MATEPGPVVVVGGGGSSSGFPWTPVLLVGAVLFLGPMIATWLLGQVTALTRGITSVGRGAAGVPLATGAVVSGVNVTSGGGADYFAQKAELAELARQNDALEASLYGA